MALDSATQAPPVCPGAEGISAGSSLSCVGQAGHRQQLWERHIHLATQQPRQLSSMYTRNQTGGCSPTREGHLKTMFWIPCFRSVSRSLQEPEWAWEILGRGSSAWGLGACIEEQVLTGRFPSHCHIPGCSSKEAVPKPSPSFLLSQLSPSC